MFDREEGAFVYDSDLEDMIEEKNALKKSREDLEHLLWSLEGKADEIAWLDLPETAQKMEDVIDEIKAEIERQEARIEELVDSIYDEDRELRVKSLGVRL